MSFSHRPQMPVSRLQKLRDALEACVGVILCICAALLLAGLWASAWWQLDKSYRDEVDSARRDAISLSLLFKEHATRTVESTDQAVVYLRSRYNALGSSLDINKELKDGVAPSEVFNLFSIVNEKADVILSTKPFKPLNLADREHIKVHMQSANTGLYISKPLLGRVSGKWSLQMTRRISGPDGAFNGVVIASMDPGYFTSIYQKVDVGQLGSISLVGDDGVLRVRHVGADDSMGQDISGSEVFQAMRSHGSGMLRATSIIDHRDRFYAYQKLDNYPLYVTVGIDLDERLDGYRKTRSQTLTLTSLASLLIILGTAALVILIGHLIESRREALLARKAKLHFLSNMSHEFRTPLNGILGYSETLAEDLAGTRHGEFAGAIQESGLRLLALVDSVLELSALRSGKISLNISQEKLADIITHAVSTHQEVAAKKGLQIQSHIAADVPPYVQCDRVRLLQVLDKLLDNACRFTDSGFVRLTVETDGKGLLFSIIDTGPGIPVALQKTIFEKFTQTDDSAARPHDGAGLGLTIAALLVELMGGEITVRSDVGAGSTFSFRLPSLDGTVPDATRTIKRQ
ncbi:ATP-binding protein [Herbaspirillum sp. NPDC101396]|uniref:cache domain-containing sensor histidine kinase n=1 Tax=Herbaspirillum sp. NPDC101396 TaxID=3364005 RepID=UPI00383A325C